MLKFGAIYYHVTRRDEINQIHPIGGSVRMEAELSPDLRIEMSEDDFYVMGLALIIYVLELSVEGILNHIVLFFRRDRSTN